MTIKTLVLGTVEVPVWASMALTQRYTPIEAASVLRFMSGTAFKQSRWQKISTQIASRGNVPPGLDALDYTQPMTLKCIAEKSIVSPSNVIVLPAARRSDAGHVPHGFAENAAGQLIRTPLALAADTATLTVVSGAVRYVAMYFPQITVYAAPPQLDIDEAAASFGWSLDAQEV